MMALLVPILMLAAPLAATQPGNADGVQISRESDAESLDAIERELNLLGEQLERFRAKAAAERAGLAAWEQSEKGRELAELSRLRAAASRARNVEQTKALWARIRPLSRERTNIHAELRRDVLAVLTPEQQKQLAGYVLHARVLQDLIRVSLSDAQRAQIRETSDTIAAEAFDPDMFKNDPFLSGLNRLRPRVIAEARERVLTPQQNEQLRDKRMPRLGSRPGTPTTAEKEIEQ